MIPIYIDERMEEMDKNKNGRVSLDEFIGKNCDYVICGCVDVLG